MRQNDDVHKKGPRLDSPQARPSAKQPKEQAKAHPRGDPRRVPRQGVQEATQGAVWAFLNKAQSRPPPQKAQKKPPGRAASILDTVREEGSPTTLGKVPNPTTLGIFFPVRQGARIQEAIQGASQGTFKSQSKAQSDSLGPSYIRRGQGLPHRRHRKRPLILDTVRKEGSPTTLGKAPNPTTLGIFFPVRQNDAVPAKRPQARFPPGPPLCTLGPKALQGASQGASKRRPKPRRVQETIQGAAKALPTQGAAKPRRRRI